MLLVEVFLEVFSRELVVIFKLAIVALILLNRVVSQMDVFDVQTRQIVLLR